MGHSSLELAAAAVQEARRRAVDAEDALDREIAKLRGTGRTAEEVAEKARVSAARVDRVWRQVRR